MAQVSKSALGKWAQPVQRAALAIAKLAGYDAGKPSITRTQHWQNNTNPNSISAQVERVAMMWNAEYLAKNEAFAIGYNYIVRNYCTPTGWTPNTGKISLNKKISEYLKEAAKTVGINQSLKETFSQGWTDSRIKGDSVLIWTRNASGELKLMQASADQIGELYTFSTPFTDPIEGLTYFGGMYFDEFGTRQAFKVYERGFNQVYTNPRVYPASDVIYFADNLLRSTRGITKFHGTIVTLEKAHKLFQYGMDAAQKQAKVAVVQKNNLGAPLDPYSYDQRIDDCGNIVYIEKNFDGAETQFQFNGDSFDYMTTTSPGEELIEGCRYADERSCLSLGFTYSFLVNMSEVGGAPSRLEIEKASKEIGRLCELAETPYSRVICTLLLDAADRGIFGDEWLEDGVELCKGTVDFPTLPTADAFRDTLSSIKEIRAGLDSPQGYLATFRKNPHDILEQNKEWAIMVSKTVEDANRDLIAGGYKPTVTNQDIAQTSDNPQQAAAGEVISQTGESPTVAKPVTSPASTAKLSAFMGDVFVADLPESVRAEIAKITGKDASGMLVTRYGMTADELARKADSHNLEAAQRNLRYCSNGSCSDEVHANDEKMILLQNDRVLDGHHFLARALKGKVTKSLPVVDLSPIRFQT